MCLSFACPPSIQQQPSLFPISAVRAIHMLRPSYLPWFLRLSNIWCNIRAQSAKRIENEVSQFVPRARHCTASVKSFNEKWQEDCMQDIWVCTESWGPLKPISWHGAAEASGFLSASFVSRFFRNHFRCERMTAFMRSSIRTSEFKMLFADSFCIPQVFETAVL